MLKIPEPLESWQCPKCRTQGYRNGSYTVRFTKMGGGTCVEYDRKMNVSVTRQWPERDIMDMTCTTCGYTESRLPLDADDAENTSG